MNLNINRAMSLRQWSGFILIEVYTKMTEKVDNNFYTVSSCNKKVNEIYIVSIKIKVE